MRIYAVGFGMPGGGTADMDGYSMYMAFDEETLKSIAEITKGEYFHAASATELAKIYQQLNARYVLEKKETEVGALAVAGGRHPAPRGGDALAALVQPTGLKRRPAPRLLVGAAARRRRRGDARNGPRRGA